MTGIERHEIERRLEHLEHELSDLRREIRNDTVQVGKHFCRSSTF